MYIGFDNWQTTINRVCLRWNEGEDTLTLDVQRLTDGFIVHFETLVEDRRTFRVTDFGELPVELIDHPFPNDILEDAFHLPFRDLIFKYGLRKVA
jgi:hypothetical protein